MQLPTSKTTVSKCLQLGFYCQTMLSKFPANVVLVELAAKVGAATSAVSSAQLTYAQAVVAMTVPRVEVKFADYSSDNTVRGTMRAAETADGVKGGKIADAVFPGGVTPIVKPVGATQVTEMRKLEGRLEAAAGIWPGALAEKVKVMDERVKYEAALAARKTAMEQSADKRSLRDAAKEDFLDVYASASARVKGEFPRNRAMQDLFFDKVNEAGAVEDGGDAADDDDVAPAADPPAGAPPAGNPA